MRHTILSLLSSGQVLPSTGRTLCNCAQRIREPRSGALNLLGSKEALTSTGRTVSNCALRAREPRSGALTRVSVIFTPGNKSPSSALKPLQPTWQPGGMHALKIKVYHTNSKALHTYPGENTWHPQAWSFQSQTDIYPRSNPLLAHGPNFSQTALFFPLSQAVKSCSLIKYFARMSSAASSCAHWLVLGSEDRSWINYFWLSVQKKVHQRQAAPRVVKRERGQLRGAHSTHNDLHLLCLSEGAGAATCLAHLQHR